MTGDAFAAYLKGETERVITVMKSLGLVKS